MIDKLKDARVLVVGDAMLDKYVRGEATRMSPEGPFPILDVTDESQLLGGAGNVVSNLDALGVTTFFVFLTGRDRAGKDIHWLLNDCEKCSPTRWSDRHRETTIKTRYLVGAHQLLRVDRESTEPLGPDDNVKLIANAEELIVGSDVVVVSDYGKGVVTEEMVQRLTAEAAKQDKRLVVDPKVDFRRYAGAYLVTPNLKELAETGWPVGTNDEIELAARAVLGCKIENVLVTRGADGMLLVTENAAYPLPSQAREVFDVTGAGDTVVAVVAAALAVGESLYDAARLANRAAGIVVGKVGTAVVTPEELEGAT